MFCLLELRRQGGTNITDLFKKYGECCIQLPVSVAARSKALVFGRSTAEIVGSNPNGDMEVCLL